MNSAMQWLLFTATFFLLPPVTLGIIRKVKARLQNRIGAPIWQPYANLFKLLNKDETISETASWLFRFNSAFNLSVMVLVAFLAPWLSYKPNVPGDDLFLIIYLLVLTRFFTILTSLDTGSAFGAFGASREATLSLLVEPSVVLSLIALAVPAHSTSVSQVFAFSTNQSFNYLSLWLLAGTGLFLSSLVELSRMPVDDPTTHLELTMVHEAMIIENSGKNLALLEFSHVLRLTILYGISVQCYIHALSFIVPLTNWLSFMLSILGILAMAIVTAIIEGTAVKLQWQKVPEFIAYSLTMSLLAVLVAVANGAAL